jgi:hypothetical protein
MDAFLKRSGIDARFVDLAFLMTLGVWPWLVFWTLGMVIVGWKTVVLYQAIALPFAILGWAAGFRSGQQRRLGRQSSFLLAGWFGLAAASVGLTFWLWATDLWGLVSVLLLSLPMLALLMTVGIKVLYREESIAMNADESLRR